MFLFSLFFFIVSCIVKYEYINLTILDQISSNQRPTLLCQNITDIPGSPLLKVADDFYIPPMSTFILNNIPYGIDNCKSLIFSIAYRRSRYTMDPENIILQLMKGMEPNENNTLFKKTFIKPSNGWNINSNDPGIMILIINIGDKDDLGNEFDISSSNIIYSMKIWVSLWVSLKRDFIMTGLRENMFYWITYSLPKTGIIPREIDSPYKYYNKTSNYYFKDQNNLLRKGLINWTPAKTTELQLDINSVSLNMAWKVDLECRQTIHFIDINNTDVPDITIEPPFINITRPPTPLIPYPVDGGKSITIILILIALVFVFITIIFIIMNILRCLADKKPKDNIDLTTYMVDNLDEVNKENEIIILPNSAATNPVLFIEEDDDIKKKFIDRVNIEIEVV
jgi:hypothetical protein